MRRTTIALSALVAAGLMLAGCSDDGDGTTPQASEGSGASTPEDTTSSDDPGGSASGDLVAWAGEFCGVGAPLQEEMTALGEGYTADPDDPLGGMADMLDQLGPAFDTAADSLEEIGPPPIEGGEEAFDAMLEGFRSASDIYAGLQDQLAELDPDDPNFQEQAAAIFSSLGSELEDSMQVVDEVFNSPEMTAAIEAAPACEGLDMAG